LGFDASDAGIVEAFGVFAEALGETQDGVEADATEAGGGAAARALGQVCSDGDQGVLGGAQAEQGRVGAFREVGAATDAV
jgi:hypothetical protein